MEEYLTLVSEKTGNAVRKTHFKDKKEILDSTQQELRYKYLNMNTLQ